MFKYGDYIFVFVVLTLSEDAVCWHVQKRLGKKLRGLKKKTFVDDNGQVLKLKWGGRERLTDSVIDSLAVYYGGTIRNFPGDVESMYRTTRAVFHHSLSSYEKQDHQSCPTGPDSWCKYNHPLSNDEEPPMHTPKLPMYLRPFIKPVFTELSKRELLEKCVLGATQNQNESLNNIIWSRCPKTGFGSRKMVGIAVHLAVIPFNHGLEGLSPLFQNLFGSSPRGFTASYITSSDSKRIKKSVQKAEQTGHNVGK